MGLQRGKNRAGLAGTIIDLPNVTAAKFHGDCFRWELQDQQQVKALRGRGTTSDYATYRYLWSNGGGVLILDTIEADWPAPESLAGQAGNVIYILNKTAAGVEKKITVPILVTSYAPAYNTEKDEGPKSAIGFVTTGPPVFSGWTGTQPTAATRTRSDMQMWEGTVFVKDPKGLQSNAQVTVDWCAVVANTDAGDVSKLDAMISATQAPFTGLKLRAVSHSRYSIDGGTTQFAWSLTDTEEDWVNPRTQEKVDPKGLASGGSIAAINATPATPGGYKDRGVTTQELNDNKIGYVKDYGLTDTKEDWVNPRNQVKTDPLGMETGGTVADINATPATPSGLKSRGVTPVELNDSNIGYVKEVGLTDTEEDWINPRSKTTVDPQGIESNGTAAAINATPATPSGFKVRGLTTVEINDSKTGYVKEFGLTDTKEDWINSRSKITTDPEGIESGGTIADIDNIPTAPGGLKDRGLTTVEINDELTGYVREVGLTTTAEDWVNQRTKTTIDPEGLESSASVAAIGSTPSAPGGLQSRGLTTVEINDSKNGYIVEAGINTTKQDREYQHTGYQHDPQKGWEIATGTVAPLVGTQTAASYHTSLIRSNLADETIAKISVKQLTPSRVLQIIEQAGDDKLIHAQSGHTQRDPIRARPACWFGEGGTGWGNPDISVNGTGYGDMNCYLYLVMPGSGVGGYSEATLVHTYVDRTVGRFMLRRRYIVSESSIQDYLHWDLQGKVSNDWFCYHKPQTVRYVRPVFDRPQPLPAEGRGSVATFLLVVDYLFDTDSHAFLNDGYLPSHTVNPINSITHPFTINGWYPQWYIRGAADFGLVWPNEADFSVFLT